MSTTPSDLGKRLTEAGVRYCLANYVDLHGRGKGKVVPVAHVGDFLKGSELYTGAALHGVPQDINDDEVASVPDPDGMIICPWDQRYAWFPCDLTLNGEAFEPCSRQILKRVIADADSMGLGLNLGIEVEFYVFRDEGDGLGTVSVRDTLDKPCYDLETLLDNMDWMDEVVQAMNDLGWDVYSFDHEDGISQFELDFAYSDVLTMCDRVTFLHLMLKEMLKPHGLYPTFMAKPFSDRTGSGGHFNMSIEGLSDGRNRFHDPDDPRGCQLASMGYHFTGGILRHAGAISSVIAPTVNSYKRLIKQGSMSGSTWAPVFACYGDNNRTNMMRIPSGGNRVECRAVDSICNPYLAAAMMFAAGLEGIREGIDPGEPNRDNLYLVSDQELEQRGITWLPRTLEEALDAFAADPLPEQVFGSAMRDSFLDFKRAEWDSYTNHVSAWERERYLHLL